MVIVANWVAGGRGKKKMGSGEGNGGEEHKGGKEAGTCSTVLSDLLRTSEHAQ